MSQERISRIEIKDFCGTEHAAFEPGSMTIISGANGAGKSSILAALRAVFEGGSDPDVQIRKGADRAVIQIELESGVIIKKTIRPKSYELIATSPDGTPIKAVQTYVNSLADKLMVDPGNLLTADEKSIAAELLKAMPIEFDEDEIEQALGVRPDGPMSLKELERARADIYERRKTQNVKIKQFDASVTQIEKNIPKDADGDGTDWKAIERKLDADIRVLLEERNDEVRVAQREMSEQIERAVAEANRLSDLARDEFGTRRLAIIEKYAERDKKLTAEKSVARERADNMATVQQNREFAQKQRDQWIVAEKEAKKLTKAIETFDSLKKHKLENLPVAGLVFSDDQVLVDGVRWPAVNKARRAEVAFQICQLKTGNLPVLIFDEAEMMDPETWQAFCDFASESGYQIIAARVASGPLSIAISRLVAA